MDDLSQKWEDLKRVALMSPSHLRALTFSVWPSDTKLPLLSLRWRLYLDVLPIEQFGQEDADCWRVWAVAMDRERQNYTALKKQYIVDLSSLGKEQEDLKRMNPLSLDEDSPWNQYHRDQELRNTILQDVTRTFPDEAYFRAPRVQRLMADMLFVYAKMHSGLQYRQGMHELLAPLLMAVDGDAVDGDGAALAGVLDRRFIEHDAFALFGRLMRLCMAWYQIPNHVSPPLRPVRQPGNKPTGGLGASAQTPIVSQCYLMMEKLALVDPRLHEHLQKLDIEPQLFGIRWYRLLFNREVAHLRDVFALWDMLFADNVAGPLRLVDWVGVVFLLANRRRLLHGDYEECLTTLLHLPPLPQPTPETLELTPALPNTPLPLTLAARPVLADAVILAPKIPYAALTLPSTTPVQRLALQAAYLRGRPSAESAALVAQQYEVWEEEAWDVIEDDMPLRSLLAAAGAGSSKAAESGRKQTQGGASRAVATSSLPIAVPSPQTRKVQTGGTIQQRRTNGASPVGTSPRSPRSTMPSPPLQAGCVVPLDDRPPVLSASGLGFYSGVRSPGEAVTALGSVTAQVASIAAQCLDMMSDGTEESQKSIQAIAAGLHAVSRVWQEEVVKSADEGTGGAAAAETDLREVLHSLDHIHIRLSRPPS
ncbi:hypothetical protein LPJ61_001986 [Coemansia biformis]|uniref:Rab-GAP TBC domain-containing protein n=1 Tax=Coemansia biformis TaxID=1286918 RepID=A0A9W7Y941_9FUNG|nr:hypothetical protein LPJ61_001986 [Coemansia biformis]